MIGGRPEHKITECSYCERRSSDSGAVHFTTENILRVQADATLAVLPGLAGDGTTVQTVQLGSTTAAFNNVFATTFTGTATQANTIQVDGGSYPNTLKSSRR